MLSNIGLWTVAGCTETTPEEFQVYTISEWTKNCLRSVYADLREFKRFTQRATCWWNYYKLCRADRICPKHGNSSSSHGTLNSESKIWAYIGTASHFSVWIRHNRPVQGRAVRVTIGLCRAGRLSPAWAKWAVYILQTLEITDTHTTIPTLTGRHDPRGT